jgi:hypothetical protein
MLLLCQPIQCATLCCMLYLCPVVNELSHWTTPINGMKNNTLYSADRLSLTSVSGCHDIVEQSTKFNFNFIYTGWLQSGWLRNWNLSPIGARFFSFPCLQTVSGALPTSYPMNTLGSFGGACTSAGA